MTIVVCKLIVLSLIGLILFNYCVLICARKFPSYIQKCHQTDTNFTKCIMKAVLNLKPHLQNGIPEFRLPKLDPLVLPEVGIDAGSGFIAKFQNVEIYDVDKFVIKKFDINLAENKIKFDLFFPHIRIKANYFIYGKLLFFNLDGSGPTDGNMTNSRVIATVLGERYYSPRNKQHLKLTGIEIENMDFGKPTRFYLYNLFKNNPELTWQTNKILNDNMQELLMDLKPSLEQTIGKTVLEFVGRVFTRFSIEELFPK